MFEFNTAGINRGNRAGDFRQLIVSILLHSSRFEIIIMGFTYLSVAERCSGDCSLRSKRVRP